MEEYVTQEFKIRTPLKITAKFELVEAANDSVELQFHSSVFEHFDKETLGHYLVVAACEDPDLNIVANQVTNRRSIILNNLRAYTDYKCGGSFEYEKDFYDIEKVKIKTGQGIPGSPDKIDVIKVESFEAEITWTEPEVRNGIIQEYKIQACNVCEGKDKSPICHDVCKESCREFMTIVEGDKGHEIVLDKLAPWTTYEVRIAARTEHPDFGHYSKPISFKTSSSEPNKPEILKISQSKTGGLVINFDYPCPMTGPTEFNAHFEPSTAKDLVLGNISQVFHR